MLNLRRTMQDAGWKDETSAARAGRLQCGRVSGSESASFAFPADASVFRIFQNYTTLKQLISDAIRFRKVFLFARGLALRHELFDFRVVRTSGIGAIAEGFQLLGIIVLEHRKYFVKGGEKIFRGLHLPLPELALIHGDVGFAYKIKHCSQG